jgi:hypothetical protein
LSSSHLLASSLRRLIERFSRRIGERFHQPSDSRERELEEMARDPAIQRELREIEAEFAMTESDGLEIHP